MTEPELPPVLPFLLVVDAANVVGSVPDGWWRDRAGAAARLRDALTPLAGTGLPEAEAAGPIDVVLVVEGQAREVPGTPAVPVIPAESNGDDTIVELVSAEAPERDRIVVVTADRELRRRVEAVGAETLGPRTLLDALERQDR
ncbi:PIN domain-containing protein [Flindersiella endophytica]